MSNVPSSERLEYLTLQQARSQKLSAREISMPRIVIAVQRTSTDESEFQPAWSRSDHRVTLRALASAIASRNNALGPLKDALVSRQVGTRPPCTAGGHRFAPPPVLAFKALFSTSLSVCRANMASVIGQNWNVKYRACPHMPSRERK